MTNNLDTSNNLAINKVLILYILKDFNNGLIESSLFKLVTQVTSINYFLFKQILADLLETNLVGIYTNDDESTLKITSTGQNAYKLTDTVLPGLIKLTADIVIKNDFPSIQEELSIVSEFIPKNENDYTIVCKIVENNETIFSVKTFVGSKEMAKKIVDNWNTNANTMYPKILNILLGDIKNQ